MNQNASLLAQNRQKHLFEHPKWSRNNFEKNDFFRPGDGGGPTVCPHRVRTGGASDKHQVTTGTVV